MIIDLNADLGEGCASDSALLQLVSSANIACGFHAGDALLMHKCVREALKNGPPDSAAAVAVVMDFLTTELGKQS